MPDGLVKNISDIDKLVNIRVSNYIHICYMLFNQQQCFIYLFIYRIKLYFILHLLIKHFIKIIRELHITANIVSSNPAHGEGYSI